MLRSIGSVAFVAAGLAAIVVAAYCFDAGLSGSDWKRGSYQSAAECALDAMLPDPYTIEAVSFCPESDAANGASLFIQVHTAGTTRVYLAFVPLDTMRARCSLFSAPLPVYGQDDRP